MPVLNVIIATVASAAQGGFKKYLNARCQYCEFTVSTMITFFAFIFFLIIIESSQIRTFAFEISVAMSIIPFVIG